MHSRCLLQTLHTPRVYLVLAALLSNAHQALQTQCCCSKRNRLSAVLLLPAVYVLQPAWQVVRLITGCPHAAGILALCWETASSCQQLAASLNQQWTWASSLSCTCLPAAEQLLTCVVYLTAGAATVPSCCVWLRLASTVHAGNTCSNEARPDFQACPVGRNEW